MQRHHASSTRTRHSNSTFKHHPQAAPCSGPPGCPLPSAQVYNIFFPTLTCGVFVFSSVSACRRRLPSPHSHSSTHSLTLTHSHSLTHSHTLTHSHSLTHTLTHTLTHSPHTHTHSLTLTHTHSLTHTHTLTHPHSLTHSLTLTLTHSLTHSHTHSLMCILRGRRGTMCTAKGSDVRPGVPWGSAAFAWQAWDNVHCQGVGCTPWRPLGLRRFCVAGVGQCALPRGWMYALASLGAPPLLRGRRGTMCTAKGLDVRPGVPWGSAAFAWQAWDNLHCQGV